ncbi:MAG: archaeosortase/exosortase family protein [Dehalococcoidales bacterium]
MKSLKLGLKSIKVEKSNFAFCSLNSKVLLWLILSLAISLIFLQEFWSNLGTMLSPDWIFRQNHAAPWGVLGLCVIWLWLKRKNIGRDIELRQNPVFIPLGLALVVGAVLIPPSPDFLVFQVLLASLGVFVIFFGRGARIPSILLTIYGFAISFPLMIARFAEGAYSQTAITPLMGIMTTLGYQIENQGQWVHFISTSGEPISAVITAACAGPATMGVFIAIFALMMLDIPLPPRKAARLFLFGVVGTWFQSLIRLIILILVGFHLGEDALWTAHSWSIYILFPLWYLFFAYIYFRQARGKSEKLQTV